MSMNQKLLAVIGRRLPAIYDVILHGLRSDKVALNHQRSHRATACAQPPASSTGPGCRNRQRVHSHRVARRTLRA